MRAFVVFVAAMLLSHALPAQVAVSVQTSKAEYLVGEPIIILVEVRNFGDRGIPYGNGCDFDLKISAEQGQREAFPRYGCFRGYGAGGSCSGIDHPPRIQPGESMIFKQLLKGYQLGPGRHTISVSGKAPLVGDIEGNYISVQLDVILLPATEAELQDTYALLVRNATSAIPAGLSYAELEKAYENRAMARAAILEMAPPFLEEVIKSLLHDSNHQFAAIDALARIDSVSSRQSLVESFAGSSDPYLRSSVVQALAYLGNQEQLDFFSGLLLGESTAKDAAIQSAAIEGLGRIGGERAVDVLAAFRTDNPQLNDDVSYALGLTKSSNAVTALIDRSSLPGTENSVCGALATLTHRDWCSTLPEDQWARYWNAWWLEHRSEVPIYGDDQCAGAVRARPIL
jgi:hypothetical protein